MSVKDVKLIKVENIKVENIKVENIKVENIKVENIKVENIKVENIKVENIKVENIKVENIEQQISTSQTNNNVYDDVALTIRILFYRQEVLNLIGKGGKTLKNIKDQSGAQVFIPNGLECVVTITGTVNAIYKATELIGLYLEEGQNVDCHGSKFHLTFNLIVPASKCGSIIGKGGCNIKKIMKSSVTTIKISPDLLPNSTERLVSITGTANTVSKCIFQLCNVLLCSNPQSKTIHYNPCGKTLWSNDNAVCNDFGRQQNNVWLTSADLGLGTASTGGINQTALDELTRSQSRTYQNWNTDREHNNQNSNHSNTKIISMTVPHNLIGCVIGRGGTKLEELRQISGAFIYINAIEGTHENAENEDRHITIVGNKDSISVAKYLIEKSVQLKIASLEESNSSSGSEYGSILALSTLLTEAQRSLLSSTPSVHAIGVFSMLHALGSLTNITEAYQSTPIQTTGVHRQNNDFKRNCRLSGKKNQAYRRLGPY